MLVFGPVVVTSLLGNSLVRSAPPSVTVAVFIVPTFVLAVMVLFMAMNLMIGELRRQ
jgi:hypothetical protein